MPDASLSTLSPSEAWSRLLDHARHDLTEQTFRTWLEPTRALRFDGNSLVVGAPDQFAADWNDSKHSHLIAAYAPVALGHPLVVVFKVNEERRTRPQMDLFVAPPADQRTAAQQHNGANIAPLSDRYTFEHFVIGNSNDFAAASAQAVAQAPGKVYNPF